MLNVGDRVLSFEGFIVYLKKADKRSFMTYKVCQSLYPVCMHNNYNYSDCMAAT